MIPNSLIIFVTSMLTILALTIIAYCIRKVRKNPKYSMAPICLQIRRLPKPRAPFWRHAVFTYRWLSAI